MLDADRTLVDVTDLVEFLERRESVSGVQRVIAETAPLLLEARPESAAVVLDRARGEFVALTTSEVHDLLLTGARASKADRDPDQLASAARGCLQRAHGATTIGIDDATVLVFLGAVWISDAMMLAARDAQARGARCLYLLYDLTPVLETGHTAAVNRLFDRYLTLITQTGSAVPAISESSRNDYVGYCESHGLTPPAGRVTGLPCGLAPTGEQSEVPWPRPYVLFVGTVESRKNHLLALRAWRELIERHGEQGVPDLVCVGRLGWHSTEFLNEYVHSRGLDGKVSVLSTSLSDADLIRFYTHAQFTLYPSRYEGWGLPVSESLAFGKLPVVARNSSLPEAGRDLAAYFASDDLDDLVRVIEDEALDDNRRQAHEARIASDQTPPITWHSVARTINAEIDDVREAKGRRPVFPTIELGREYMLAVGSPPPDAGHADQYLAHLQGEGSTPMLGQPRGERDFEVVDAAVIGTFGAPQTWGNELRPGRRADFRLTRPVDGELTLLVSTRSMPGVATVEAAGPGGPLREQVYLGSVIVLPLGSGQAGDPAQVSLTVLDATDSIEGFVGIRSFVVLRSDDLATQVIAHRAAAQALRQELDFITNTRSWKITAPLRKAKGRGAS